MNPYYYGFFQDLMFDVLEFWDKTGANAWQCFPVGQSKYLSEPVIEYEMQSWAKDVLADPNKCLTELGYNSGDFASYVSDNMKREC